MVIQSISTSNNIVKSQASASKASNETFKANEQPKAKENNQNDKKSVSTKVKAGVLATTALGVALAYAQVLHGKGFKLANLKGTSFKNWGIFKVAYEDNEMPLLITKLAAGSVGGGLIGGAIFDKKNMKAKYKEAVIQIIGNIFIPLGCVFAGVKAYKKIQKPIVDAITKSVKSEKAGKYLSEVPGLAAQLVSLFAGIMLGNRVGNLINQKVFHSNENRKLKVTDMAPHVDDVCAAATMMDPTSMFGKVLARLVPLALTVGGVATGIAQNNPSVEAKAPNA